MAGVGSVLMREFLLEKAGKTSWRPRRWPGGLRDSGRRAPGWGGGRQDYRSRLAAVWRDVYPRCLEVLDQAAVLVLRFATIAVLAWGGAIVVRNTTATLQAIAHHTGLPPSAPTSFR